MIFFVLPDDNRPIGGIKQAYRHVQILNEHGIDAYVLHERDGFRCTWFEHTAPIAYLGQSTATYFTQKVYKTLRRRKYMPFDLSVEKGQKITLSCYKNKTALHVLGPGDLVVLPEFYGIALNKAVTQLPVAVFNQNPHGTFRSYPIDASGCNTIYKKSSLTGVVVVSDHSQRYLNYAFPDIKIHRVTNGVDRRLFHPRSSRKPKTLAFMPRKLPSHVEQLINLLRYHGALDGWSLVPINGLDERGVAERLRESSIFVSTCTQEGFGLPPLEAAMSGCLVVGYNGQAAEEYMDPNFCRPVPQDDVLALARAVDQAMRDYDNNPAAIIEQTRQFSELLSDRYSLERERESVVTAWECILECALKRSEAKLVS